MADMIIARVGRLASKRRFEFGCCVGLSSIPENGLVNGSSKLIYSFMHNAHAQS